MIYIKTVIVGDGAVGKTSMLIRYTSNYIPTEYQPTIFDNYSALVMYENKPFNLGLWDTAGQEDFDKLRHLSYPHTDVFLLCYSVVNPNSFKNCVDKWISEIKTHSPESPIILVGTQMDLRENDQTTERLAKLNLAPVSTEQGEALAAKLGAAYFCECSSLTKKGLHEVFEKVIEAFLDKNRRSPECRYPEGVTFKCNYNSTDGSSAGGAGSGSTAVSPREVKKAKTAGAVAKFQTIYKTIRRSKKRLCNAISRPK
ncbi:hypothetical protein SAMD00019534_043770 [Acytostelium subglobosum LB1]|uniref:hypothetical protein n=1 Tax=Acytostelium subglobosum LB1 TaxID=1410327 RepID=UPI0006449C4B|nr:hypothetical protein SAMD00019534_043770 [Acytostelium subglobosum LB1]GAM21202.1 hypothetical protein SAMD00019534_043770 [Acytostelium subglobosum LB1]|eukprot:XP_012756336.1 hypothetical protein SAMD00019534_043770 [Acytostelium subglobosum LB1]